MKTLTCLPLLLTLFLPSLACAQDVGESIALQPLPEEVAAAFDQVLSDIELSETDVESLRARTEASEGLAAEIFAARRDGMWTTLFHDTLNFAQDIAD
jgi:hypothetical protein